MLLDADCVFTNLLQQNVLVCKTKGGSVMENSIIQLVNYYVTDKKKKEAIERFDEIRKRGKEFYGENFDVITLLANIEKNLTVCEVIPIDSEFDNCIKKVIRCIMFAIFGIVIRELPDENCVPLDFQYLLLDQFFFTAKNISNAFDRAYIESSYVLGKRADRYSNNNEFLAYCLDRFSFHFLNADKQEVPEKYRPVDMYLALDDILNECATYVIHGKSVIIAAQTIATILNATFEYITGSHVQLTGCGAINPGGEEDEQHKQLYFFEHSLQP